MMPRIRDIQFSRILSALRPTYCPHETFQKLRSIVKRSSSQRLPQAEPKDIIHSLSSWLSKEGSSLFVLRVGTRAETQLRELTIDVINTLQKKSSTVLWRTHDPQAIPGVKTPSFEEVIKLLIHQILELRPSLLHPQGLDIAKFRTTHATSEWTTLFQILIRQLPSCYVILETHDLFQERNDGDEEDWLPRILEIFQGLAEQANSHGHVLKFLVTCYGNQSDEIAKFGDVRATMRKSAIVPVSRRNVLAHRKGGKGWVRVSPKL